MSEERISEKLINFKQALARLEEAVREPDPDQFVYDAAIKRFEFTYELAWKLLKAVMEFKGVEGIQFPRDVFKEGFSKGLLMKGEVWLDMIKDRNLSSHTYNFEMARDLYRKIKNIYFDELAGLIHTVEGEMEK